MLIAILLSRIPVGTLEKVWNSNHFFSVPILKRLDLFFRYLFEAYRWEDLPEMFVQASGFRSISELQCNVPKPTQHRMQATNRTRNGHLWWHCICPNVDVRVRTQRLPISCELFQNVHHSNIFRQRLGKWLSPTRCYFYTLLDWDSLILTYEMDW